MVKTTRGEGPVWKSVLGAFQLLPKFWMPMVVYLIGYSFIGALASVLLPYTIINGQQAAAVPPKNASEAVGYGIIGLTLFFMMFFLATGLLGGVLESLRQILSGQAGAVSRFWSSVRKWFFRMGGWGVAYGLLTVGLAVLAVFPVGFFWAVTGRAQGMRGMAEFVFYIAVLVVGYLFLYSPGFIVFKGSGLAAAFKRSARFVWRHKVASIVSIFLVSLIGALIYLADYYMVAPLVGRLRAMLGVAPFAKGAPAFFFGLILNFPAAILFVYIPLALGLFVHHQEE